MSRPHESDGFICSTCGHFHGQPPISFAADFPDSYLQVPEHEREARTVLGSDQCIIDENQYFIRGLIELPILGSSDPFLWGVWATVWRKDYDEISDHWETPGRETLIGPYKGRLNNRLLPYPDTLNLKCTIQIQPVASRPLFVVDEPEHPLALEQRIGISMERVREIASRLIHNQ